MRKVILFLLIFAMLTSLPSCKQPTPEEPAPPADPYSYEETIENWSTGFELSQIKELYVAAGEGSEAFDVKLHEFNSKATGTRDGFLTAYNHFKDQVIVVWNNKKYEQFEFSMMYKGTKVYSADASPRETSVDILSQAFGRRDGSVHVEAVFYGSCEVEPIYDENMTGMVNRGELVDAMPITEEMFIKDVRKDGYKLEVYVQPYPERKPGIMVESAYPATDLYYLRIYRQDGTFVGTFRVSVPNNVKEYGWLFGWHEFIEIDFMTLEEYVNQ